MKSILPSNSTDLERLMEIVSSNELTKFDQDLIKNLDDPLLCPKSFLPYLAWSYHVDTWDSEWSEQVKRDVIHKSIELHSKYGTPYAISEGLRIVGLPSEIVESHEDENQVPFTFALKAWVKTLGQDVTSESINKVIDIVMQSKRQASRFRISVGIDSNKFGFGVGFLGKISATINCDCEI